MKTEGIKFDEEKPPLSLLPREALEEIARVMDFGANVKGYGVHNWRHGLAWSRVASALLRHIFAWLSGEDKDPESGLSHMAHAGCCVLFILTYIKTEGGQDDRYVP